MFLRASNNNRASTVMSGFQRAISQYPRPSRIRTDYGGENVEVGRYMQALRGDQHNAWLQGSSVHNQRIERLWRDMRSGFTEFWEGFFRDMERQGILDVSSDRNLTALHYVFLPIVNRFLDDFTASWNHHKIRTEQQRTPHQLYVAGMLERYGSDYTAVREILNDTAINPQEFGVEFLGGDLQGETGVNVMYPQLSADTSEYLVSHFPVDSAAEPFQCIDIYLRVRLYLSSLENIVQ